MLRLSDAVEYCYEQDDNETRQPVMMLQSPPAAPDLLTDLICECKENCDDDCWCHQNSQSWTAAREHCRLSFDCEDNCACSTLLTMAATETVNCSKIKIEPSHDNH